MLSISAPKSGPMCSSGYLFNIEIGIKPNRYNLCCALLLAALGTTEIWDERQMGFIATNPSPFSGQNTCTHLTLDGQVSPNVEIIGSSVVKVTPNVVVRQIGDYVYTHIITPDTGFSYYAEGPDLTSLNTTSCDVYGQWIGSVLCIATAFTYAGPTSGGNPNFTDIYYSVYSIGLAGRIGYTVSNRDRLGETGNHKWTGLEAWNYIYHGVAPYPPTPYTRENVQVGPSDVSFLQGAELERLLRNSPVFDKRYAPRNGWGELAYRTYSGIPVFQGNGLAYVKDLLEVRKQVRKLGEVLELIPKYGKYAKAAADLFLAWHYGARLTIKDTKELIDGISNYSKRFRPEFRHYGAAEYDYIDGVMVSFHYEAFIPPYDTAVFSLGRLMRDFDLNLTLENVWDLVPFSFVVDWFVNVQSMLDRLDKCFEKTSYQISYVGYSEKATVPLQLPDGWTGNLTARSYRRWYSSTAEEPRIAFESASGPFSHVLEGSTLIISSLD